jgi:hypothetical protein
LNQRSHLRESKYGPGFKLATSSPYTDVTDSDFESIAESLPPAPNVFIWHTWPDDLIHDQHDKPSGPAQIARVTTKALNSDSFWTLVERLRQGRRLLITSDHGYAISGRFVYLPSPLSERMRDHFGAGRYGAVPTEATALVGTQPLVVTNGGRASVVGHWKWKPPGGYPYVCHGGLTLSEVCVPFVEFAAL